ncbi:allantoate ureidosuccinate permease [Fusarium heterosporum]|uniref:Allantoate ureidosuccinate permease n=1 Tax=Fusarium heterosporum TaxID=42747 RepID=A0A8H5SU84_FUSHE|nr:allantoate ureidosuccinate permease [Fusarium heterosporum]
MQMQPLAERRRGMGPIKQREKWTPQSIVPKTDDAVSEGSQSFTPPALTPSGELQLSKGLQANMSFDILPVESEAATSPTDFPDIPLEDMINSITIPQCPPDASSQLILYPTPSFNLLSLFPSFSFTNPTEPAPSIGSDDVQAMTFHSTVLAPMKSTRQATLSAHSIFLNFAVQNPMALHFLLAFSHSELAIHHGFSHRPPLESYLHFQKGSQLLSQALVTSPPTNHVAMMLSYLYLYMFWMRRDPLGVGTLRELSISILAQGSELTVLGKGLDIKNKLDKIRAEQNSLFTLSRDCAQQSTQPPLMALVTLTIFHALEIYLYRSRDTFFGETPVPADIERALRELVSAAYHTIPAGPVQLLERFQWALLIAGIETHDLVYRDWISASISDSVIKGVYNLVLSAKTLSAKGISMEAVRDYSIMEAKDMKEPTPSYEMDVIARGTVDMLSAEEEKKLVRKIDMRLMPLLIISYGLQYLDKTSLAYGAILGLREDLQLVGQQFSWASSIFYIGYLVASYPISIGFVKFPLGRYLSVLMFFWGIILTLHSVAHNYASLMVLRFFLGVFESAISPGFSLITGMWYTPHEHVSRHSFWFAGNASASMVGAMIAYGILNYDGPIEQWKMLFLIFGLITIAWSVLTFFLLPDSPGTAKFLSTSEREFAAIRPKKFQRTTQTKRWDREQFIETMKDVKAWWFFFFSFIICIPNGGTTSFSTIVIKSFGYDEKQTILMGLPASAFQLTTVILVAVITTYVRKSRHIALVLTYIMAIAGILMIKLLPSAEKLSRLAGFWLIMAVAPAFPLMLSLSASNIAGFTKKSTVMAMIFLGYCAGNLSGPQFFINTEAPGYPTAYTTIMICYAITIALVVGIYFYLTWENRRRDSEQGVKRDPEESRQVDLSEDGTLLQVDETDRQNKNFSLCLDVLMLQDKGNTVYSAIGEDDIRPVLDKKLFKVEQAGEPYEYQRDQKHIGKVIV